MASGKFQEFGKSLTGHPRQTSGEEVTQLALPAGTECKVRQPGGLTGRIWIADDFDETSPEIIAAMEGDID